MHRFLLLILLTAPQLLSAASITAPKNFRETVNMFIGIIGKLTYVIFALITIAIVWGIIKGWIFNGESTEGVGEGKNVLFVGVIVLVILLSTWGIIALLRASIA